jgi:ribonucleoside-diphosphate reductase alpha chain
VTGANISIRLSDEFLTAVENDTEYELRWPVDARENGKEPVISEMVNAKAVWKHIVESAHFSAEPGLLFWDNIIRESPADCYADAGFKTVSTNPCSEIPLSPLDSCRLLLTNLLTYVKNPWTENAYFDYPAFEDDVKFAQRMMDDLVDLELEKIELIIDKIKSDPEKENIKRTELETWEGIKYACEKGRRTGSGVTAVGDTIAAMGMKYGSEESISFVDKIYKSLKLAAYRSSVDMAKEIGPFEAYDYKRELNCPFIQRIAEEDPKLYKDMIEYGRRNIAILTTAPAGSMSIMTQTSSGIEPVFMLSYKRRKKVNPEDKNSRTDFIDQDGNCWEEFIVFHQQLAAWGEANGYSASDLEDPEIIKKSPWYGCCAEDLNWESRVQLQAAAQRHVDHAISSTINLPKDTTAEQVSEIYVSAWKNNLKGITVYRKDCRCGVLVDENGETQTDSTCKRNSHQEGETIIKTDAPKRPKKLPAEVHHTSIMGKGYFVLVGMLNGDPYEIFVGENGFIPKTVKTAIIQKVKRGHYRAILANGEVIENISEMNTPEEEAVARLTSVSLRHGADISVIVHQLEKTRGDLSSFAKALSRTLKKHITDGTKVTGEICLECGSENLVRQEGCMTCKSCGWSKCS